MNRNKARRFLAEKADGSYMRDRSQFISLGITVLTIVQISAGCGRYQHAKGNEKIASDGSSLLVLGDSLSTGIFTSPRFALDYGSIVAQAIKGERPDPSDPSNSTQYRPIRLRKPSEEIKQLGQGNEALAEALLKVIEWPELSWANIVGGAAASPPDRIVLAARNGAQTANAKDEVDSWLNATPDGSSPLLPAEVYVFFSGDDLCRSSASQDSMTSAPAYAQGIRDGVHRLAQGGAVNPSGTKVYLVSHLDILQQVTNRGVFAEKRIHLSDPTKRETSCQDFVKAYQPGETSARPEAQAMLFTYNPMNICYNVLAHADGLDPAAAKVPLVTLKQTIDGYRSALATVALELQADPLISSAGMTVKLITTTHDLKLVSEDLANDCFHLSNIGQDKLAKAIMAGK